MNLQRIIAGLLKYTWTEWGHSRWQTLETCPKKYELRYIRGIKPLFTSRAATLGTVVHRGLAGSFLAQKHRQQGKKKVPEYGLLVLDQSPEGEDIKIEAKRLVIQHDAYWADHDPGWDRVVHIEKMIQGNLDGVPYSTRMDLVAKHRKLPILVDTKTSSRSYGDPATEFQMSGQFLGMLALWQQKISKKLPIVRINRIVKTAVPTFERIGLSFSQNQIDRFKKDLVFLHSDLDRFKRNRFPRRYHSCVGKYGPCEYFNLCYAGPSMAGSYDVPDQTDLNSALR